MKKEISLLAKVYIALAIVAVIVITVITINTKSLLIGLWLTLCATGVFWIALEQDFGIKALRNGSWLYKEGGQ